MTYALLYMHWISDLNIMFLATPAYVIDHYYCFLADNLSNDVFCQIMLSLKLVNEEDHMIHSMAPSEYQRNTLLLDHLLVSGAADIERFCSILQDSKGQQQIGYMLMNGMNVLMLF